MNLVRPINIEQERISGHLGLYVCNLTEHRTYERNDINGIKYTFLVPVDEKSGFEHIEKVNYPKAYSVDPETDRVIFYYGNMGQQEAHVTHITTGLLQIRLTDTTKRTIYIPFNEDSHVLNNAAQRLLYPKNLPPFIPQTIAHNIPELDNHHGIYNGHFKENIDPEIANGFKHRSGEIGQFLNEQNFEMYIKLYNEDIERFVVLFLAGGVPYEALLMLSQETPPYTALPAVLSVELGNSTF